MKEINTEVIYICRKCGTDTNIKPPTHYKKNSYLVPCPNSNCLGIMEKWYG